MGGAGLTGGTGEEDVEGVVVGEGGGTESEA